MKIFERTVENKTYRSFWCPGCEGPHTIDEGWQFNGDIDLPTISPSIKAWHDGKPDEGIPAYCCHSFVREGRIEFLSDCTHKLAGTTAEIPEYPESYQ